MSHYIIDCEADGPIPHKYSLVSIGVVKLTPELDQTFYGETRPISNEYIPEALRVSGFSREEHLGFDDPKKVFEDLDKWVSETTIKRPIFWSDNPAFDWQWTNYYFHYFLGRNPFGHSARRIGDVYSGLTKNPYANFKHLRKTKHTHNPVDDAIGNGEALLKMKEKFNWNIGLT